MKGLVRKVYAHLPLKQPVFEVTRRLLSVPEPVYRHLHFKGTFETPVDGRSFKMVHYGYQVENAVFWDGLRAGWEHISLGLWRKLCLRADVIFDVGANTGIYALVAKALRPSAGVYAFEPLKRVHDKLVRNVRLNGYDVICEELAASDRDGDALIDDPCSEHVYSVSLNRNLHAPEVPTVERRVRITRLDSYIRDRGIGRVDLMKIDVETHEFEVLKGLGEYLGLMRPPMLVEVLTDEVGRNVQSLVADKGYLYFSIDEQHPPRRVEHITRGDDFHYRNYLLCSEEVARSLALGIS